MSILLLLVLVAAGCRGSKDSTEASNAGDPHGGTTESPTDRLIVRSLDQKGSVPATVDTRIDPGINALGVDYAVNFYSTDSYSVYFSIGAGSNTSAEAGAAARRIERFEVAWYSPDGTELGRSESRDISSSGTLNTQTNSSSITIYGMVDWKPESALQPGSYAVAMLIGPDGASARRLELPSNVPPRNGNARCLNITVDANQRGTGVEFTISVERVAPAPQGEYLPSGEKVRVELYGRGDLIWSSAAGRMFSQMIGTVEPTDVGDRATYREIWSGRNDIGAGNVGPGTYDIVVTIPAKPVPYIIREEFNYSGR